MDRSVNLRQLKYFVAVAEELSFRRAATRLCITQPPLSRQIHALEEHLGALLFERGGRRIALTDTGMLFLERARALLRDSDRLVSQFGQQPAERSGLNLGITTVIDASLFSWIEPEFAQRFPSIRLNVKRQLSAACVRDLNRGVLDVAVIGLPSHTEGLVVEHLLDEPMVVGLAVDHPAGKKRKLSLSDIRQDHLFWFDRKLNPAYHDHCERIFARNRFAPPRIIEPSDYHILLSLVAEGQGVALIPRSLKTMQRKGVLYKDLDEGEQLGIAIAIARRTGEQSGQVAGFIAFLKERLGSLGAISAMTSSPAPRSFSPSSTTTIRISR
ncbi:transcriptional regulator, LysR family [Verminephrobacter eiseniae EF01-2]|uniref:Transcriptional regulator, LysR family n=1 Tax=Verminephrobacter eiseniae (strain EF01-2) TaxID=391735 RepID=A1WJ01_VEREI|nr:transcriptional regulator, LysR family [Verminephrobacter eiseniae EF01-2]MCW5283229.1 LysR family transcriptional regulator [Verminephrobacter eiseniae]MCW5303545.1 LysR family transcriptional regulator [Verminephrobacter eiseniae]MCW8178719.1 LysR family transcriptional regulator [Verminephrobacter eiseniae]MCW8188339.1 LysR family transcriptional regulator [Verminephrobacter eiseniae]